MQLDKFECIETGNLELGCPNDSMFGCPSEQQ